MTDTTGAPGSTDPHCTDPHDHTGHDHPPTGADLVQDLVKGLSILALLIPVLAVVMLLAILPAAPTSPVVLLLGIALGAAHLVSLVVTSFFVSRTRKQLAVNPGLLAVRSAVEELLRVAAVLIALLLWPADIRAELGVWVGAGAALVWLALATAQTVSTRRRIARPSNWSKDAISTLLSERVGARSTVVMRLLDVIGTAAFQIGATVLVVMSPVLVIGTVVLSIGSGLSTLVLQRRAPAERSRTPWAYAPVAIGLLTLALASLSFVSL
ncbi:MULTISPECIES: hypothetical protein [Brachybacterium]|uniref:Uncharacterized protein n=1 Tax=Brachybacterium alimentarium TaxID=47845 RepID=A0A2A3YHP4_9MICO|nr:MULTISPECIES: hypothetical protein [Brachybacterium]PCC35012.1 hypothetical protein CIK71_05730 [Brachybacterium alimentarium]PCC38798.1 hypothetical protein CIK66_12805 [Brachybacterium alimentarium]RCS65011.1 hypothetical protein CIK81_06740 [Brachybacterium sp. JB7]RCS68824.1 hypothetical protein CIK73_06375 [Brachybacterium alimentarium]RCS76141.1 hypothetical protein CIK68_02705 [Brachybacterium alimentarium]